MTHSFPYKWGKVIYWSRKVGDGRAEGGTSWERGAGICGEEEIGGMWQNRQITAVPQAYSFFLLCSRTGLTCTLSC